MYDICTYVQACNVCIYVQACNLVDFSLETSNGGVFPGRVFQQN